MRTIVLGVFWAICIGSGASESCAQWDGWPSTGDSRVGDQTGTPSVPEDMRWEPLWRHKGDCGPMSLYVIMRLLDFDVSVEDVKAVVPFDPEMGCSLADLARGADALGFEAEIRFVNQQDLTAVPCPFIYHSEASLEKGTGNFGVVVSYSAEEEEFAVFDTAYGSVGWVPDHAVYSQYSGYVLLSKRARHGGASRAPVVAVLVLGAVSMGLLTVLGLLRGRGNPRP